jgi:hypothetical protein
VHAGWAALSLVPASLLLERQVLQDNISQVERLTRRQQRQDAVSVGGRDWKKSIVFNLI